MAERFGRYENLGTIASGGMATVYLGRAVGEGGFERLVAIKVMHPHIAEDEQFRSMFLDEARLAARIRHPNVVGVLDVQRQGDQLFLVMEYVDGPSLHQLRRSFRKRNTMLPIGIALRIVLDTLNGLHTAHEIEDAKGELLNLIHRDVTPQNILVGRDGVARITDFGVARAESRITSTRGSQLKGKIAYMPPEQMRNEPLDRRADIYAAGVVMWEALAGQRLFKADSEAAIVHMVMEGASEGPRRHNEDVSPQLDYVCMRAIRADREHRYEDAAAFADAIEEAARISGLTIPATRQVARFIREVPDLEGLAQPTSNPSANTSLQGIDDIPDLTRQAVLAHRSSAAETSEPSGLKAPTTGTTTNAVLPTATPTPPQKGRIGVIATVAVAMAASAALTYALVSGHQGGEPTDDPGPAAAAPSEPEREPESEPATERAEPTPEADEPQADEPQADEPEADEPQADEPDEPDEPETDEPAAKKPPVATHKPGTSTKKKKSKTKPGGHKGPGYNPTEL